MYQRSYRIGTTSYIVPDDILPNARYLASQVDDIELVLFEVDDGPNNLPDEETIFELNRLAEEHQLSYTVHLPLDIKLGTIGGELDISLVKAEKVINCTRGLDPVAYVLHLDGRDVRHAAAVDEKKLWDRQAVKSLEILTEWSGSAQKLAVENLENYPPDFWDEVLDQIPVSRCIDIGHLWLEGHDPLPYLRKHLARTRVIHLHGIHKRDHQSLQYAPSRQLEGVFSLLDEIMFNGVVTLEVFSQEDFISSMKVIRSYLGKGSI